MKERKQNKELIDPTAPIKVYIGDEERLNFGENDSCHKDIKEELPLPRDKKK